MGCFPSVEDKSAKERSELIDKKILQDAKACENVIKLLLLGKNCSLSIIRVTIENHLILSRIDQ